MYKNIILGINGSLYTEMYWKYEKKRGKNKKKLNVRESENNFIYLFFFFP